MVKQESSTPGVYLVGPSGGKLRPWCGHCHKFLKSENAAHDCTPVSPGRRSSGPKGSRRRIRLTDKNRALLKKVFNAAAIGEELLKTLSKLKKYTKRKSITGKRLSQLTSGMDRGLSKTGAKRVARLEKHFL